VIPDGTILLSRKEVRSLLSIDECIDAVEKVFRLSGEGKTPPPGILGIRAPGGGFHIKAGLLEDDRLYFAAKLNSNFPENPVRTKLPTIQGVIVLCDGENGFPLAVMDSIEITILRTGAATAVAAKYLSRNDSDTVTVCGCGTQGRIQLRSLLKVRALKRAFFYDANPAHAERLAKEFSGEITCEPVPANQLSSSLGKSAICVTCTPSEQFFIRHGDISPGTFIAAVGADSEHKQELDPLLFASARVIVDSLDQCATIGDLHHALDAGVLKRSEVHADIGEVAAGKKPGRTSDEEVTIFDSTGIALEDCAAALRVYKKALKNRSGKLTHFD
jgi:alanine dehydrogenase